jgi:Fe-S-cluster containining protein
MVILEYKCMKCGSCCHEISESPGLKRIPLYPEEVNKLIKIAKSQNIEFMVIEDLVFPDILNKKVLVITYRIKLDNSESRCPFYKPTLGCTIHETKPLACQAYPLSIKQEDAFTSQISIDPLCKWTNLNYDMLTKINSADLKKIFKCEYVNAEKFLKKNKKLIFKIRELEAEHKIQIAREITLDDFNKALNEWNRKEIIV